MVIKKAEFIKSASSCSGFYSTSQKQFAVAGRSNVGKSSFINMLASKKNLARTSSQPGRTRLINYFDMGNFVLADLPGYGYAKASIQEKENWKELIESYLESESSLLRVLMLVDIRHEPGELDIQLAAYLYGMRIPFNVIATKADKIARGEIKKRLNGIAAALKIGEGDITAVSSQTGYGREQALALIEKTLENSRNL